MSAIAALLHLDGKLVDSAVLQRMLAAARPFGSDAEGIWIEGRIGMAATRYYTTRENGTEDIPLIDEERGFVLAWDGRLDNRKDLLARFDNVDPASLHLDGALLLHAYSLWGVGCLGKLVGDFAFILWDSREQRLLAARDQLGIRPLHFTFDGSTCLIASRINQILQNSQIGRRINDGMVGNFLIGRLDNLDETFFQDIQRVPPGHYLEINPTGLHRRRYWTADPNREIQYSRSSEYVDHFRSLLQQAVESRLSTASPTGLLLSGGLDSNAIACVAAEIGKERDWPSQFLYTFTGTYEHLGSSDERRKAEPIIQKYDLTANFIPCDPLWTFKGDSVTLRSWDEPLEGMYVPMVRQLIDCASSQGIRVLLTGYGGDLLLAGNYYYLFDLLASHQWQALFQELGCYPLWLRGLLIFENLAKPLIIKRPGRATNYKVPSWISPNFAAKIEHQACYPADQPVHQYRSVSRQIEFEQINIVQHSARMLWLQSEGLRRGIELRHPFMDLRLFEFLLAVPVVQKIRHGRPKIILRKAVGARTAPPQNNRRRNGRLLDHKLQEQERSNWEACFADACSASLGYIDLPRLHGAFARYISGNRNLKYSLARVYRLEMWLKVHFGSPVSSAVVRSVST
jgi:asparagine synthase (glutamine-hydrolysing)